MIWILAQSGELLACATAIRIDEYDVCVECPRRYRVVAYNGDDMWVVGEYSVAAQAQEALRTIVEAVKSGARFVDLRPLEA